MEMCLAGLDGEVLAEGYPDVPVIHGFRPVPEIGGGCIMALIDQSEAFRAHQSYREKKWLEFRAPGDTGDCLLAYVAATGLASNEAADESHVIPTEGGFR
jgi:hypothetical protein